MKNYEISEEIVKGLIAYLQTKPYSEVAAGIAALSQLKEITTKKTEPSNGAEKSKVLSEKE